MPCGPKPKARRRNAPDLITPPQWLPQDVRPTWEAIAPLAVDEIKLQRVDMVGLADLCTCLFRMNQAEEAVTAHGVMVEGQRGIVKNPAIQVARDYRASLQNWCRMYGWTPVHRKQVERSKAMDQKPKDDFLEAALKKLSAGRPAQ